MTNMTREELITNLKDKLGVAESAGPGPDLVSKDHALVIVMEVEEITDDLVKRFDAVKTNKKRPKLYVAIPPKATIMNEARARLAGSGIGVMDGRGFIIKPYSWTHYRSVTLGTM